MKFSITVILIHIFLGGHTQIIINGKIRNYDGKSKVYYTPTLDGIMPAYVYPTQITPNPNGTFRIKYENRGYGTVGVGFGGLSFSFFHNDKTKINFVLDQARIRFPKGKPGEHSRLDYIRDSVKQAATVSIEGDFVEVNRFYNKSMRTSSLALTVQGCDFSILIQNAGTPEKAVFIIDSLTQIELNHIDGLRSPIEAENPGQNKITPDVKQFLKNEVRAFYGSVFLSGMMLKRHEQGRKLIQDPTTPLTTYNKEWEQLIEAYFTKSAKNIKPSANSFEYNEFILSMAYAHSDYKTYDFEPPLTTDDQLVMDRLLRPELSVLDSLSLLDNKAVLAYKLHNLSRFLFTQTFYSPVLLNAIHELKIQYPNSAQLANFEPQIERLKAYLKTSSLNYDKAKVVETNYVAFGDLLEVFKGKNVLIDVWATWCGPCVEDFNYKSTLKPFIEQDKLTVLYVSIDKPAWEKKWRENMKYNQLEGHHVLANDVLILDMWRVLGGRQGAIPRYALVDKGGQLVLNEAARPSQGEKLVKQIENLLLTK